MAHPGSAGSGAAIRCRDLHKHYGDTHAVRGLDLEVLRGECFGLLGPNGAGKTTTIEILEGIQEADSGEVEILGLTWRRDALALRPREPRAVDACAVAACNLRRAPQARGYYAIAADEVAWQESAGRAGQVAGEYIGIRYFLVDWRNRRAGNFP